MSAETSRAADYVGRLRRAFVAAPVATAPLPLIRHATPAGADPTPGETWVTDGEVDAMVIANGNVYIGRTFSQVGLNTGGGVAVDATTGVYDAAFDRIDGNPMCPRQASGRLYAHASDTGIGAMINQARFHDGGKVGHGFYLDGEPDEIAIYNSALSPARVAAHHAAAQQADYLSRSLDKDQ